MLNYVVYFIMMSSIMISIITIIYHPFVSSVIQIYIYAASKMWGYCLLLFNILLFLVYSQLSTQLRKTSKHYQHQNK